MSTKMNTPSMCIYSGGGGGGSYSKDDDSTVSPLFQETQEIMIGTN